MHQEKKEEEDLLGYLDYTDATIQGHKEITKKGKEKQKTVASCNYIIRNNLKTNDKRTKSRKQKWELKQLHGYFKQQTRKIAFKITWAWLRRENLKRETELLLIAVQNIAIINKNLHAVLYFIMLFQKFRGRCWWYGNRCWTYISLIHNKFCLVTDNSWITVR